MDMWQTAEGRAVDGQASATSIETIAKIISNTAPWGWHFSVGSDRREKLSLGPFHANLVRGIGDDSNFRLDSQTAPKKRVTAKLLLHPELVSIRVLKDGVGSEPFGGQFFLELHLFRF